MSFIALFSAFWLGILTAISPCPLAANIAAISFISRQIGNNRSVVITGFLYTAGRTLAYIVLGVGITAGLLASGEVSRFLQKYLNEILGPVMILLGMVLLGMIGSGLSFNVMSDNIQKKAQTQGLWFSLPLGIIFALSFCPVSAGLFFGALVPLSIKYGSKLILPLVYGIGTALPVIIFAFLIALGGEYLGKAFNKLTQIEKWVRWTAGTLFIIAGVYYCLSHIYGIKITG